MADLIRLLPDALANQIAAGEVVQRPASAVKELLENAVDAGATDIRLLVKDAGKTLIQIIDNGKGMSPTDARMCFERHATSKISQIDDLFALRSYGFRGEAMASIAAVAQVELRTRREQDELGTLLRIEGGAYLGQEPIQAPVGTQVLVKNLFYNVPARRNFLKKDETEFRNISDEFLRLALSQPELSLRLEHNGTALYQLRSANLRQRIVAVMGDNFNSSLVPVEENTALLRVKGFIGKPNMARKARGGQYFFMNNRFIRDGYLHHAVMSAYNNLLPEGYHPAYFLYLDIDPKKVDVNVHPTKTEVKFEEEQAIYAILQAAVKRALSQYSVAPSLDFDRETGLDGLDLRLKPAEEVKPPQIAFNPHYNPFTNPAGKAPTPSSAAAGSWPAASQKSASAGWERLYEVARNKEQASELRLSQPESESDTQHKPIFQLQRAYLVSPIKSGLLLVDQEAAHRRILYERFLVQFEQGKGASQQLLFPERLECSRSEAGLLHELLPELQRAGFVLAPEDELNWLIQGVPAEWGATDAPTLLRNLLAQYAEHQVHELQALHEQLARGLAKHAAIARGRLLAEPEMRQLIDELFACENPYYTPEGQQTLLTLTLEELQRRLTGS
jgi:DNA mismatch repair protein MutL